MYVAAVTGTRVLLPDPSDGGTTCGGQREAEWKGEGMGDIGGARCWLEGREKGERLGGGERERGEADSSPARMRMRYKRSRRVDSVRQYGGDDEV